MIDRYADLPPRSGTGEVLPPSLPPDVAARLLGPSVADALLQPQQTSRTVLPAPVNTALGRPSGQAPAQKRAPGVLQSVPVVSPSNEHLASALKRASRVSHISQAMVPGQPALAFHRPTTACDRDKGSTY
jgi:hypothetical protein